MILRRLRLRNIRSYTDGTIDFPNGSVLLSGDIGAGKSTILHAIEFALFGALRADLPAESLLRYGENFGFVVLHFGIDGKDVTITRPLKRTPSGIRQEAGSMRIDDVHHDLMPGEIRARVLGLLGYPGDLMEKSKALIFRYTVYTPQDQMKKILGDDAQFRLNTLRRIFAIDKYKRAQENAKIMARSLREEQKEISGYIMDLEERKKEAQLMRAKEEAVARRIAALASEAEQAGALLDKARHEAQQAKQRAEEIVRKQAQKESLTESLAQINERIAQMKEGITQEKEQISKTQQDIDSLETPAIDVRALEEEIGSLEQRIIRKEQHRLQAQKEMSLYRRQKEEITSAIKDMQEQHDLLLASLPPAGAPQGPAMAIEELSLKLADAQQRKEGIIANAAACQQQIDEATLLTKEITSISECPTCLQSVTDDHKHVITRTHGIAIAEAKQKKEALEQSRIGLDDAIKALQKQILEAQKREKELVRIQAQQDKISELGVRIEQSLARQAKIEEEMRALEESIDETDVDDLAEQRGEITQKKKILERIRRQRILEAGLAEKKRRLISLEEGLLREHESRDVMQERAAALASELRCAQEITAAHIEASAYAERIDERKRELDLDLARWKTEKTNIEEHLLTAQYEILQKEHAKDRLVRICALQQWISEHFVNLMDLMERTMMLRVYHEFSDLFCMWFSLLIDDEVISARLDATFTPIITQNGHDATFSNLSGGERAAICLAFRLALNKVINDVVSTIRTRDVLLLDEPTDGFSDEQLDSVRDVLCALGLAQTIIVSHAAKVESFVDHVIRIEKSDHQSRIAA